MREHHAERRGAQHRQERLPAEHRADEEDAQHVRAARRRVPRRRRHEPRERRDDVLVEAAAPRGRVLVGGDGPLVEEVLPGHRLPERPPPPEERADALELAARVRAEEAPHERARGRRQRLPQQRGQQVDAHVGVPPREPRAVVGGRPRAPAPRRERVDAHGVGRGRGPVGHQRGALLRGPRAVRAEHGAPPHQQPQQRVDQDDDDEQEEGVPLPRRRVRQVRLQRVPRVAQDVRLRRVVAGGGRGGRVEVVVHVEVADGPPPHAVDHQEPGGDHRDREDAHGDAPREPLARGHLQVLPDDVARRGRERRPQQLAQELAASRRSAAAGARRRRAARRGVRPLAWRGGRRRRTQRSRGRAGARARGEAAARAPNARRGPAGGAPRASSAR